MELVSHPFAHQPLPSKSIHIGWGAAGLGILLVLCFWFSAMGSPVARIFALRVPGWSRSVSLSVPIVHARQTSQLYMAYMHLPQGASGMGLLDLRMMNLRLCLAGVARAPAGLHFGSQFVQQQLHFFCKVQITQHECPNRQYSEQKARDK